MKIYICYGIQRHFQPMMARLGCSAGLIRQPWAPKFCFRLDKIKVAGSLAGIYLDGKQPVVIRKCTRPNPLLHRSNDFITLIADDSYLNMPRPHVPPPKVPPINNARATRHVPHAGEKPNRVSMYILISQRVPPSLSREKQTTLPQNVPKTSINMATAICETVQPPSISWP